MVLTGCLCPVLSLFQFFSHTSWGHILIHKSDHGSFPPETLSSFLCVQERFSTKATSVCRTSSWLLSQHFLLALSPPLILSISFDFPTYPDLFSLLGFGLCCSLCLACPSSPSLIFLVTIISQDKAGRGNKETFPNVLISGAFGVSAFSSQDPWTQSNP